jgi:hypothetical protein
MLVVTRKELNDLFHVFKVFTYDRWTDEEMLRKVELIPVLAGAMVLLDNEAPKVQNQRQLLRELLKFKGDDNMIETENNVEINPPSLGAMENSQNAHRKTGPGKNKFGCHIGKPPAILSEALSKVPCTPEQLAIRAGGQELGYVKSCLRWWVKHPETGVGKVISEENGKYFLRA